MVTPVDVKITDTGKRRVISGSAEETRLVAFGAEITLKGVEVVLEIEAMVNDAPQPNKFESNDQTQVWGLPEIDAVGMQSPKWTIRGALDMNDTNDMILFSQILRCLKTKGVKLLKCNMASYVAYEDSSYCDMAKTMNATITGVYVRPTSFTATQTAESNIINYTIELRESA